MGGSAGDDGGSGGEPGGFAGSGDDAGDGGDGGSVCGPLTETRNCGRCGHDCTALPYVNPDGIECRDGVCAYGPDACLPGFGHCSTDPADADEGCMDDLTLIQSCGDCSTACMGGTPFCGSPGVETPSCVGACTPLNLALCGTRQCVDLQTNAGHCGACGRRCSQDNGYAVCVRGACVGAGCVSGYADCDGALGCETHLRSFDHCSRCGDSCAAARATSRCEDGGCVHECDAGFGDCDPASPDCETPLDTSENCGACGNECPSTRPICSGGSCVSACDLTLCGTACVDMATDVRHCGACGSVCERYQACEAGRCTPRHIGTGTIEYAELSAATVAMHSGGTFALLASLRGNADFDPGPGVVERTARDWDAVLTLFNADGSHAWTHLLGGDGLDSGGRVTMASDGSVIATVDYSGTVDLDPGAGTSSHTATGSMGYAVVKLAADGTFVWARSFNASGNEASVERGEVAVDGSDAVYAAGSFTGNIDLDPGAGTVTRSASQRTSFLVKLTSAGSFVWGVTFADCMLSLVDTQAGTGATLWLAGAFSGTCDLDPGAGSVPATALDQDALIVELDASNGAYVRSRTSNLAAISGVDSIANVGGSPFFSGFFMGEDYQSTGFVLRTSPTLVDAWTRNVPNLAPAIAPAPGGGVVAIGTMSFGPGPHPQGLFMTMFDGAGARPWTIDLSAPGVYTASVASSAAGFVAVGSNSGAPFDADPGPGTAPVSTQATFITRYAF